MRKLIAALLTLVIAVSLAVPSRATNALSQDIVILYTSDVHTYIDGPLIYDVPAAIKSQLQTQSQHVLLVGGGLDD